MLCLDSKDKKGKMQDNQDRETSTDEVRTEDKKIKRNPDGARFFASVQIGLGPLIQWLAGLFPGGKAAGAWR